MDKKKRGALRCAIVESGLATQYTKARKKSFFDADDSGIEEIRYSYGDNVLSVCRSLDNARVKRAKRVRDKMTSAVLAGNCYFLTLTFDNDCLDSTTVETRRRYVARWLKANYIEYAANIDFGDKGKNPDSNEREHYHALVSGLRAGKPKKWKHGFTCIKSVKPSEKDAIATSLYSSKLSNHALKVNGGYAPRLIYSRKKKKG